MSTTPERESRTLHQKKPQLDRIYEGYPPKNSGYEGELRIHNIKGEGLRLYIRKSKEWYFSTFSTTGAVATTVTGGGGASGDITSVTAGTGLSGGGTTGDVTLTNAGVTSNVAGTGINVSSATGAVTISVSGLTVSELAANSLQTSGESFVDNDTSLMTSAAIQDKIQSFSYITLSSLSASTPITYNSGTGAFSVSDHAITLAKLPEIATARFLGRNTSGTGDIEVMTVTQASALLNLDNYLTAPRTVTAGGNTLDSSETLAFTEGSNITITESGGAVTISATDTNTTYSVMGSGNSYAAGLVLAGSATHGNNFLRKDGTWATPSGFMDNFIIADTDSTQSITDGIYIKFAASNSGAYGNSQISGSGTSGSPYLVTLYAPDTDTDRYVNSASFNTSNGVLTLTRAGSDTATVTVDLDGRYLSNITGERIDDLVDVAALHTGGGTGYGNISNGQTLVWNSTANYFEPGSSSYSWYLRDGDTTALEITSGKYVKLVEGTGIDINFTDTDSGAVDDEYDVTITNTLMTSGGTISGNLTLTGNIRTSTNTDYAELLGKTGGLEVRSSRSSNAGIAMSNSSGSFRFQLYGDASGNYGFLQSFWGAWDLKKTVNGEGYLRISGTDRQIIHAGNIGSQSVDSANVAVRLSAFDNRTISPSEFGNTRVRFGFTSYANNNSSPYADAFHMSSYGDSSGGSANLVMFKKSGIGMRIWQQSFNSSTAYSSYADAILSNGGTMTATLNWNTTSFPHITTTGSHGLWMSSNGGDVYLYDGSKNHFFYIYSGGTSKVFLSSTGESYFKGGNVLINGGVRTGEQSGTQSYTGGSVTFGNVLYATADANRAAVFRTGTTACSVWWAGSDGAHAAVDSNKGVLDFWVNDTSGWYNAGDITRTRFYLDNYLQSNDSVRAPVFYDSGNTAYYWNPATSSAHRLQTPSGYLDLAPMNSSWCHFQTDRGKFYFGSSVYIDGFLSVYGPNTLRLYGGQNSGQLNIGDNNFTYCTHRLIGSKNSYQGFVYDIHSNYPSVMFSTGSNGGFYFQSGRWAFYHHYGNNCAGINTGTTSSSYGMYVSGSIYSTADVIAYSDIRLKTNISTIDNALNKVTNMRGVYYEPMDRKTKKVNGSRKVGVIAQELQEVLPEAVTYAEDVDEYGVDYGKLTGVLIEAIKELKQEINELKGN